MLERDWKKNNEDCDLDTEDERIKRMQRRMNVKKRNER